MILLAKQPRLTDVRGLASKVANFPISAKQLVELATDERFPKEVIDFYRAFPKNEVFQTEEDLLARTEQLEIMHSEADQPAEIFTSAEED